MGRLARLEQHILVCGPEAVKPRAHWAGHLVDQLRRLREVLDSLITERLMRRFKECSRDVPNSPVWERTIVSNIYNAQVSDIVDLDQLHGDGEFELACTSLSRRIRKGDFVRFRETHDVGEVLACRQADKIALIVTHCSHVDICTYPKSAYWSLCEVPTATLRQWPAHPCEVALGWKQRRFFVLFVLRLT